MKVICHVCIVILTWVSLAACSDHRLVNTDQRLRVKKVDIRAARIAIIFTFNYNSTGRLASFTTRTNLDPAAPSQLTVLQYDKQGRLIQWEAQPTPIASGRRTVYEYDTNGNLVLVTTYVDDDRSGNYILQNEVILTYEGTSKDPVRILRSDESTALTYQDGNVIETVTTFLGPVSTSPYRNSYMYDNRPNPLYNLSAALINTSLGGVGLLSRNNTTSTDFVLTYNTRGLLEKRSNVGLTLFSESTYEYEAY